MKNRTVVKTNLPPSPEEIEDAKKTWTDKERLEEYIKGTRISSEREADTYRKVLKLYRWWKDVYPHYEDNSPWSKYF